MMKITTGQTKNTKPLFKNCTKENCTKGKKFQLGTVVVNFLYQLFLATGCLDIWLNVILGVSVRVFLDEINV